MNLGLKQFLWIACTAVGVVGCSSSTPTPAVVGRVSTEQKSASGDATQAGGPVNKTLSSTKTPTTVVSDGTNAIVKVGKSSQDDGLTAGAKDLNLQVISKTNVFRGVQGFLVKDSDRLRATINQCLDAGLLAVKAEMIVSPGRTPSKAETDAGRKPILPQTFSVGSADIIETLADDLYNPRKISRVETSAGILSLEYLGALATVADVVAWNCDFSNPSSRCNCGTEASALKILQRCVPSYTDSQLADLSKVFAASCSADKSVEEKRQALAAFIASTTFAESR